MGERLVRDAQLLNVRGLGLNEVRNLIEVRLRGVVFVKEASGMPYGGIDAVFMTRVATWSTSTRID
jgi:hypothetical protein